mmetsp:Transcript_147/g.334  ORF Transcript_147/g.334 Transcript_147/m.334 type:complete len:204 (-) Transcript_147:61-672(-)
MGETDLHCHAHSHRVGGAWRWGRRGPGCRWGPGCHLFLGIQEAPLPRLVATRTPPHRVGVGDIIPCVTCHGVPIVRCCFAHPDPITVMVCLCHGPWSGRRTCACWMAHVVPCPVQLERPGLSPLTFGFRMHRFGSFERRFDPSHFVRLLVPIVAVIISRDLHPHHLFGDTILRHRSIVALEIRPTRVLRAHVHQKPHCRPNNE